MSTNEFYGMNVDAPLLDIFPKSWNEDIKNFVSMEFRNLEHFKHTVSQIKQKDDSTCGISYDQALKDLLAGTPMITETEQQKIRNLVRKNLHKRGLITQEVYEEYKYSVDGVQVGVDVAKYANGEADCIISPARQYIDFFYELYISISYPWDVENSTVMKNTAKLLATVEELERQHIFIKIVLVLPTQGTGVGPNKKRNLFSSIPLFSHKDVKSVGTMSSVLNDRLLRKFYFALMEAYFQEELSGGKGYPMGLKGTINIGDQLDEIKIFTDIMETVGAV